MKSSITVGQLAIAIPALLLAFVAAHDSPVRLAFVFPLVLIVSAFAWGRFVRRNEGGGELDS